MENVFKLNAFAAAHTAFCEWIQVGIDLYVPPYVYIFFICTNRIPYQIRWIAWTILTLPLQYYMSSIALGRSWSWQSASSVNCWCRSYLVVQLLLYRVWVTTEFSRWQLHLCFCNNDLQILFFSLWSPILFGLSYHINALYWDVYSSVCLRLHVACVYMFH